jgi:hypothetical protein
LPKAGHTMPVHRYRVFATIPPSVEDIPPDDDRLECEMIIQTFLINVFGCLDNLANVWVKERGVVRANGRPIAPLLVGLGEKCTDVRKSLPAEFQAHLGSDAMKQWFEVMEGYRHALAHRIPLYIPPYAVKESNQVAYAELEEKKLKAMREHDMEEYDRLEDEEKKLCHFQALMTHSWEEQPPIMYFHAQMLTDFETIVDLARRMDRELKGPR